MPGQGAIARVYTGLLLAIALGACAAVEPAPAPEPPLRMLLEESFELAAEPGQVEERSWTIRGFSGLAAVRARVRDVHASANRPPEISVAVGAGTERTGAFLEIADAARAGHGLVIQEPLLLGTVAPQQLLELSIQWDGAGSAWIQIGGDPQWHRLPVEFTPETLHIGCASARLAVEQVAIYSSRRPGQAGAARARRAQ